MDQQTAITEAKYINSQIPNPYNKNTWYQVTNTAGKTFDAMPTKPGFLRCRMLIKHVLKSPDGTILQDYGIQYSYFRVNYITGKVESL